MSESTTRGGMHYGLSTNQKLYTVGEGEAEKVEQLFKTATLAIHINELNDINPILAATRVFCETAILLESEQEFMDKQIENIVTETLVFTLLNFPGKKNLLKNLHNDAKAETHQARTKFPWWPISPLYGAAIVAEEAGELLQACNNHYWDQKGGGMEAIYKELVQLVAMCIRFYTESIVRGEYESSNDSGHH